MKSKIVKNKFSTPGLEYIFIFAIGMLLSLFPAITLFIFLGADGFFMSFCFLLMLTLMGCIFGIFRNLSVGEAGDKDLEIARRTTIIICIIVAFFCLTVLILALWGYFDTFFDLLDSNLWKKAIKN